MHNLAAYRTFRDRFREAMDPAYYPIDYLDHLIASGKVVMFHNPDAAIVVGIREFPSGLRVVHGLVAAGEISQVQALIGRAEQWGRENNCTKAMIETGREGWARAQRGAGYRPFQISIVKDL